MDEKIIIGLIADEFLEIESLEETIDILHEDNGVGEDNE